MALPHSNRRGRWIYRVLAAGLTWMVAACDGTQAPVSTIAADRAVVDARPVFVDARADGQHDAALTVPAADAGPLTDQHHDVFLAPSDLSVIADFGALPDLAPLPADEGVSPDAAPPVVVGPPHLRLVPRALSLREAREPGVLRVSLEGELLGPAEVEVDLQAPAGLEVSPARFTLTNEARSAVAYLTAPIDADSEDTFGRIVARAPGLAEESMPFVVYDSHLTWEMGLDADELDFVRNSNDKARRLTVENTFNGRPSPSADINLRGKGTLVCPRRSFTVRFQSPTRVQDSPPLEDVILIALCEDPLVLRSRVSLEMLSRLNLFPGWFSYVELRYGPETRGLYLMIERPRKAIERSQPENTQVIRRLSDVDVEIDRPDEDFIADREAFLGPYRALFGLSDVLQDELLLSELQRRMMYDQYLLLLAYNSVMENGDYIDEIYFFDRPAPANRPAAEVPFFDVMAWDQDEIFRPCHTPSPINEPLTFCAESRLDRLVVTSPSIRALYLAQLRRLLDGPLSPEAFAQVAARGAAELAIYLDRPGIRELHTVPDLPAPEGATSFQTLNDLMLTRRLALLTLLDAPPMP